MRSVIGVMSVGHTCPTKTLSCREEKVAKTLINHKERGICSHCLRLVGRIVSP